MRGFGTARRDLRTGASEWLFILPQSGFLVRVILRKNCTDLEFMLAPAGLHVIKSKGLSDAARRSNSPLEFAGDRVIVESDFPCSFRGRT